MTLGRYLLGIAGLAAVVAPVTFAAVVLRRRWLPDWSGSPARVAEAVLALAMLVGAGQLVGVLGLFRPGFLVATTLALGLAAWRLGGRPGPRVERRRPPAPDPVATGVAALTAAGVVGTWSARVAGVLHGGMSRSDTLSYHAPTAARFVQEHSVAHPFYATGEQLYTFFPANSELLHAIGMLLMGSDVLSPLLNLGWLGLALAAGWAIGRPFGRGPAALSGAAVALAVPVLVSYEPGEAFNDVVIVALFLAAAALLVNGDRQPAPILVAGLAAGLAVGTKVTAILPVAALTIAVVVLLGRGRRARLGALWLAALVAVGGLWYVRNLIAFGSPLPAVRIGIGPLALPSIPLRPLRTVADYATDWDIWREWFLPGLNSAFGPTWWLLLGFAALGLALSLGQRAFPSLRTVSILAITLTVVYPFTPATADGPEGHPYIFGGTLRHLTPAVALGLAVLPLIGPLSGRARQRLAVVVLAALAFIALYDSRTLVEDQPATATLIAAVVLAWFAAARAGRAVPRQAAVAGAAALIAVAGVWLRDTEQRFLRDRYTTISPWARTLEDARIAFVGSVLPYPLYGRDLSNHVQYVARKGPHGAFLAIRDCREWRRALNQGRYRYVAIGTDVNLVLAALGKVNPHLEATWTASDAAAEPVSDASRRGRIFRIDGRLDPGGCADIRPTRPPPAPREADKRRLRAVRRCLQGQGLRPAPTKGPPGGLAITTGLSGGGSGLILLFGSPRDAENAVNGVRELVHDRGGEAARRGTAVVGYVDPPTERDRRAIARCL